MWSLVGYLALMGLQKEKKASGEQALREWGESLLLRQTEHHAFCRLAAIARSLLAIASLCCEFPHVKTFCSECPWPWAQLLLYSLSMGRCSMVGGGTQDFPATTIWGENREPKELAGTLLTGTFH